MTVYVPQIVRVMPPDALMQATYRPAFNGTTSGDMLDYTLDLRQAIDACNADKSALREWVEGVE